MTLGAIADWADLIGALAVVASLIFLARQIHQNTNAVKAQTFTALSDRISQSNQGPLSEYMAGVIKNGLESFENLTQEEQVSFSYWMLDRTMVYELLVGAPEATSPEIVAGCDKNLRYLFRAKGVQEWWQTSAREDVSSTMRAYVDDLLDYS